MEHYLSLLGWKVRDKVTGYTGTVEHVGVDLYGCVQAIARADRIVNKESGEQKLEAGLWFDVARLERIGDGPIMQPISPRAEVPPGPADKPARP